MYSTSSFSASSVDCKAQPKWRDVATFSMPSIVAVCAYLSGAAVTERENTFALLLSVLTGEIGATGLRLVGLHFRVSRGCTHSSGVDLQEPRTS